MTWWDIEPIARAGVAVRRSTWATGSSVRTLRFQAGGGTDPAVAILREGAAERVLTAEDFGAADFLATDWQTT